MRIEHDVKSVTYMKTNAADLLRSVDERVVPQDQVFRELRARLAKK